MRRLELAPEPLRPLESCERGLRVTFRQHDGARGLRGQGVQIGRLERRLERRVGPARHSWLQDIARRKLNLDTGGENLRTGATVSAVF